MIRKRHILKLKPFVMLLLFMIVYSDGVQSQVLSAVSREYVRSRFQGKYLGTNTNDGLTTETYLENGFPQYFIFIDDKLVRSIQIIPISKLHETHMLFDKIYLPTGPGVWFSSTGGVSDMANWFNEDITIKFDMGETKKFMKKAVFVVTFNPYKKGDFPSQN